MNELSSYQKIDEAEQIYYEDESGCVYEDLQSFLQNHVLGFCGCGDESKNLELIYELLKLNKWWRDTPGIAYKAYDESRTKYLLDNIEKVKWFFDYFLDKRCITTHGGNVSGSWIDNDNFFNALETWHKEKK